MSFAGSGIGDLIQPPDLNACSEWNRTRKSRRLRAGKAHLVELVERRERL